MQYAWSLSEQRKEHFKANLFDNIPASLNNLGG